MCAKHRFPRVHAGISNWISGLHRNGKGSEMFARFNAGGDCGPLSLRSNSVVTVWLSGSPETVMGEAAAWGAAPRACQAEARKGHLGRRASASEPPGEQSHHSTDFLPFF